MLVLAAAAMCRAAAPAEARWEGSIRIPGRELPVVIDLAQDAGGKWTGSATFPGLNVKGAPLGDIVVDGAGIRFAVKGTLGEPVFQGWIEATGTLAGDFRQGGNSAPFSLEKTGLPQVDLPRVSTAVSPELEGEWRGEFSLNGNQLTGTLTLSNHPGAPATATFRVVGKRDTKLPVDRVTEDGEWLTVTASEYRIVYEGRVRGSEISGTFKQGPLESPLILRRTPPKLPQ